MTKKIISSITLIISDFLTVIICFTLAYLVRSEILPALYNGFKLFPLPLDMLLKHSYMALVWTFVFAYEKLYTKRYPFWEEVKVLFKSITISSGLIMVMVFITKKQLQFSRTVIVLAWLLSFALFPISRYLVKYLLVKMNIWKKKLLILGANETGISLLKNVNENKTMGYEVLGFLDDAPQKIGQKIYGVEVLGSISELKKIAKVYKSKDIIIALPDLPREKLHDLIVKNENISESIGFVPQTADLVTTGVEIENLGHVLTLNIRKNLEKPLNRALKNFFDKCLALFLLISLLPLFAAVALAIKLDSKGPVMYIQKRMGLKNKMFKLYKFRSMYKDAEKILLQYFRSHPEAKKEWEKYKKLKEQDPRVTRVGKFIRRFSLDELPQLVNVLQNKMSLVGPRPYLSHELKGKDVFKKTITKVKPGITGLWQISGRSELPFEERLALDEYYIRNWSLWLDVIILLKSIKVMLSSKGAY